MRKCEVLSITTAPASAALGAYSADTVEPEEESTMSTPRKSNSATSWMLSSLSSP